MKIKYIFCFLLMGCLLWAQEFKLNDEFSWDDDFFAEVDGSEPFSNGADPIEIYGSLRLPFSWFPAGETLGESIWQCIPEAKTGIQYSSEISDLRLGFKAKKLQEGSVLSLEEAWTRLYLDQNDLEIGLMKVTWGKGDNLHVMDIFNPINYSRFIEVDYEERKESDLMIRFNLGFGQSGRLEIIYLPWFTPDSIPTEGVWTPYQYKNLKKTGEQCVESHANAYYTFTYNAAGGDGNPQAGGIAALAAAERISDLEKNILQAGETNTIKYSQGGLRYTRTSGFLDWGVALARGFFRDPLILLNDYNPAEQTASTNPGVMLTYTPTIMWAFESGGVLGGFNFRQEGAFFWTEDRDGTDSSIQNPRAAWLFGVDRNLPFNHSNLNIQAKGEYILFHDGIKSTDAEFRDDYSSHMVSAVFSDHWNNDKIRASLTGSYNIESKDYMIKPEIEITVRETVLFSLIYRIYEGDADTLFGQFDDNDNITFQCTMDF